MTNGPVVNWPRLVLAAFDAVILNVGLFVAFWLRYEGNNATAIAASYYPWAFYGTLIAVAIFYAFGLYSRIWEHASTEALGAIGGAVACATCALALFVWVSAPIRLPHSVVAATWLIWMALIGGTRFTWRLVREAIPPRGAEGSRDGHSKRILIYGAGSAGAMLARQLDQTNGEGIELVGLVDDDPFKRGQLVRRHRVLGSGEELANIIERHSIDEVIIAIPSVSGTELSAIVQRCRAAQVSHRILPSILELHSSSVHIDHAREVDIADLLGRSPTGFPIETFGEYLRDRTVLVTGAGGSIGSEICRQAAWFSPKRLVLVGRGENRIHEVLRELRNAHPALEIIPVIANIAVREAARDVLEEYSPDVLIHAAAHKHVYLMEQHPLEAVRNNVVATHDLAGLAIDQGVDRFIMISTDKAVEPSSVMGASKRLCELIVQASQYSSRNDHTIFLTVRFGNVLGSTGSVLPIFERQFRMGQPLTITHPEVTRYFMTIPEAALLVLQSGGIAAGGEIFVLDMGEPVKISDLAAELIRLHGGNPSDPRNYRYIGMAPGEKLHERLWASAETVSHVTEHILQVTSANEPWNDALLDAHIDRLRRLVANRQTERVRQVLLDICDREERKRTTVKRASNS